MSNIIWMGETTFPVVPNPPVNQHYLGFDQSDGNLKSQNSAGVVIDYNSGASYSDADAVNAINAEIQAVPSLLLADAEDFLYVYDNATTSFKKIARGDLFLPQIARFFNVQSDFVATSTGEFSAFVTGTGSGVASVNEETALRRDSGISRLRTGSTASGRAAVGVISSNAYAVGLFSLYFETRFRNPILPTLTDDFQSLAGFGDTFYNAAGIGANSLYFRHELTVNGNRWQAVSRLGSVDVEVIDTGVEMLDTDYHYFKIIVPSSGNTALFYIDNALVATINAPNLPTSAVRMGAGLKIQKTAGSTARDINVDLMSVSSRRTSDR
jgi:hypothetical protein